MSRKWYNHLHVHVHVPFILVIINIVYNQLHIIIIMLFSNSAAVPSPMIDINDNKMTKQSILKYRKPSTERHCYNSKKTFIVLYCHVQFVFYSKLKNILSMAIRQVQTNVYGSLQSKWTK